jgi:hypothetical protein
MEVCQHIPSRSRIGWAEQWGISMERVFADEFVELQLTAEESQSVIRRQLTGSFAVAVAIVVFAVAMAL